MYRSLENYGLSPGILADQRKFIFKWVKNAIEAGRLLLEDEILRPEVTIDVLDASNSALHSSPVLELTVPEHMNPDSKKYSFIRRLRSGVIRGQNSLFAAVKKGDIARVEELLSLGIPIDIRDSSHNTVVKIAMMDGNIEMVDLLLNRGDTKWAIFYLRKYEMDYHLRP